MSEMPEKWTVRELFGLSLGAEREAMKFYAAMEAAFAHHAASAAFFRAMKEDEAHHVLIVGQLNMCISPEHASDPVPDNAVQMARAFLKFNAEEAIRTVNNLEDAYKLAVKLEYSEVNRLMEFIVNISVDSEESKNKIRAMLDAHIERVKNFPARCGDRAMRSRIKPG